MNNIEVGDYIRTKGGAIFKAQDNIIINENIPKKLKQLTDTIKTHSKNIKDLIEAGDYVNGYYCEYITDINTGEEILCNFDLNEMRWIPLENIDVWESIVTKQQFQAIEYKLGDKT